MSLTLLQAQNTYVVEAESFQFKGGWNTERYGNCLGNDMLRVQGGKTGAADAVTVVEIKQAGSYTVWVRVADYPKDKPGTRLMQLIVDDHALPEVGKHGKEDFYWEKAGSVELNARKVLLRLKDTRKNYARCDAVLLTAENMDPNEKPLTELARYRTKPVSMASQSAGNVSVSPPLMLATDASVVAEISNASLRMRFVKGGLNNKSLAAKTELKVEGEWKSMNPLYEDHKLYLLSADEPALTFGSFYPSWNGSKAIGYFMLDDKRIEVQEPDDLMNPFAAGQLSEAIPVQAEKMSSSTIAATYVTSDGSVITAYWTLPPAAQHIQVKLVCKAAKSGYYSMGVAAFQAIAQDKATNILLPPMFQYKRITPKPVMLVSGMMQQPLSIAETRWGKGLLATFVSGDIHSFPLEWGSAYTSPIGFTVKNESNNIQPVAFAPVLGLKDSKLSAGQTLERDFVIGAVASGWGDALAYASEQVYQVKDYRKQGQVSLTDAAFNMVDLINNDEASGWDKKLKSFYDIEADPSAAATVVHASPLTLVSTAVMMHDEDFYLKRALPAIEYTLSRSGYRWANNIVPGGFNNTRKSLQLGPYNSQFTTAYYEGLYALLGNSNEWLKAIALPDGRTRVSNGYSVNIPAWVQEVAAYRLTHDDKWLNSAKLNADKFLVSQVYANTTPPLSKVPFYNAAFYAYWWDLLDLYELTKEDKYLKAAEHSAMHTIAGVRSFPQVRDSLMTIHTGNRFEGNTTLWWKGNQKYRLGFPRINGDAPEKKVPQSLVSPVGLGFEQPYTYFDPGKTVRPVFMSSWAPHLLRLYAYTGKSIFQTYARNAVIGRFTNYPGYYASGFTDIDMQPDFPYKGPDVSSIYYHHIPPHLAFTWDYLVTEAIQRSNGKVQFPYGKQDGFVWFTNRLYGAGVGSIYDDKQAKLWMHKGLIKLNTPEVNYVTAVSDNKFWVLLMSESDKSTTVDIRMLDIAAKLNGKASVYVGNKVKPVTVSNGMLPVMLDAKGFAAISFDLKEPFITTPLPVLKDGMQVIDMGQPWGKLYVFRIRSPFGWDSIYGFAETAPLSGASVTVSYNGNTITANAYPYEWSFYKLKPTDTAELAISFQTADGKTQHQTVTLGGK
jgi:hypothetical protein